MRHKPQNLTGVGFALARKEWLEQIKLRLQSFDIQTVHLEVGGK